MEPLPILDELMANAWRPMVDERHGGWRYRWAEGVSRRANSALALGAEERIEELVTLAEAFYRERGVPTRIHVSAASAPAELGPYLLSRGYRPTAQTLVQAASSMEVARPRSSSFAIGVASEPTDEWFATYWSAQAAQGRAAGDRAVVRDWLLNSGLPAVFVVARHGPGVLGVGQLVIERGWGGVQCMATEPGYRRAGVARAVLTALAAEAIRRGAGQIYLAVMADNVAARSLYEGAGFVPSHDYHHFVESADVS